MREGAAAGRVAARFRALDVAGLLGFVLLAVLVWMAIDDLSPGDLGVYSQAVDRIGTDDVYLRTYPDWPFTYPPSGLLLLAWLAIPAEASRIGMYVVSIAAVWVTAAVTARACAPGGVWARVGAVSVIASALLLSWPVIFGLALGQAAPLVMGLAALGALPERSRWSGPLVGTAAAIKLTPAAFALFWVLIGRRRDAVVAGATFLAWSVLAALLMPKSSWWYYAEAGLLRAEQDYTEVSNQALTGVAARLGMDATAERWIVVGASAVLLLVGLLVARRLHGRGWPTVGVLLVGVWSGLAAPLAWTHAFGWWVPLAFAIGLTGRRVSDWAVAGLIIAVPYFQVLGPSVEGGVADPLTFARSGSYVLLGLAVTAWLWWRVSPSKRCPQEARLEPLLTEGSPIETDGRPAG